ncbi:DUF1616 domain-containing protein [Natrialbaceae archaeon A-CW3]
MSLTTRTQNTVDAVFRYPSDLAIVSLTTVAAYVLVTTLPTGSNIRLVAALAFVAFLPGYALVSVLFPVAARPRSVGSQSVSENRPGGIDVVERVALGLGLSIAIVPMIVLVLPLTEWGLEMGSVVGALALVTLVLAQLGVIRRLRVPEADRFTVSLTAFRNRLSRAAGTGTTRASAVVLAVTILLAAGMLLYAFAAPMAAGGFTQLGIYTAHDDELVADMPSTAAPGSEIPITFQIHNNEGQEMEYTLVMQEQVLENGEVVERVTHREVTAISRSTDGGEITAERTVTPVAEDGETVRIAVMLFDGDAPATPTMEDAMEYTYFWVTIETPPDAPGSADSTDEPGDEADDDSVDGGDDSGGADDSDDDGNDDEGTVTDDDGDDTVADDADDGDDSDDTDDDADDESDDDDDADDDSDDDDDADDDSDDDDDTDDDDD